MLNRRSLLFSTLSIGLCPLAFKLPEPVTLFEQLERQLRESLNKAGADWSGASGLSISQDACYSAVVLSKKSQKWSIAELYETYFDLMIRVVTDTVMEQNNGNVTEIAVKSTQGSSLGDLVVVFIAGTMPVDIWWKKNLSYFQSFGRLAPANMFKELDHAV